jgi:signal peptidase II
MPIPGQKTPVGYGLVTKKLRKDLLAFCKAHQPGAIVGGAVGNVVDRLRLRFVFDFLDFYWSGYHFAAFNLADSAITVGVAMLLIDGLFGRAEKAKKAPN